MRQEEVGSVYPFANLLAAALTEFWRRRVKPSRYSLPNMLLAASVAKNYLLVERDHGPPLEGAGQLSHHALDDFRSAVRSQAQGGS